LLASSLADPAEIAEQPGIAIIPVAALPLGIETDGSPDSGGKSGGDGATAAPSEPPADPLPRETVQVEPPAIPAPAAPPAPSAEAPPVEAEPVPAPVPEPVQTAEAEPIVEPEPVIEPEPAIEPAPVVEAPQPKPEPPVIVAQPEPEIVEQTPSPAPVIETDTVPQPTIAEIDTAMGDASEDQIAADAIASDAMANDAMATDAMVNEAASSIAASAPGPLLASLGGALGAGTESDTGSGGTGRSDDPAGSPDGGGTLSDAVLANYTHQLAQWLDRHKEYPDRARKREQQGVVLCEFTLAEDGTIVAHRILESSGYPLLDEEMAALFDRASPVPAPPPGARLTYQVPIVFALNR